MERIRKFLVDESGATAVEYGLMVALVGAAVIAVVTTMGQKLVTTFSNVTAALP